MLSIGAPIGLASAIVGLWTNDSFQELIHPDVGRAFEAAWNSGQCAEMEAFSKEYPDSPWREEALGFMQHCETVAEYRTLEQIYPVRVDQIDVEAGQSLNEAQQFARSGLHNNANDICSLLERNTQGALESVLLDEEGVKQSCDKYYNGWYCVEETQVTCSVRQALVPDRVVLPDQEDN